MYERKNWTDIITIMNAENHIGKCYTVKPKNILKVGHFLEIKQIQLSTMQAILIKQFFISEFENKLSDDFENTFKNNNFQLNNDKS